MHHGAYKRWTEEGERMRQRERHENIPHEHLSRALVLREGDPRVKDAIHDIHADHNKLQ
jgi:hypothetical protein